MHYEPSRQYRLCRIIAKLKINYHIQLNSTLRGLYCITFCGYCIPLVEKFTGYLRKVVRVSIDIFEKFPFLMLLIHMPGPDPEGHRSRAFPRAKRPVRVLVREVHISLLVPQVISKLNVNSLVIRQRGRLIRFQL